MTGGSGGARDRERPHGNLSPEWPRPAAAVETYRFTITGSPPSKNDLVVIKFGSKASIGNGKRTKEYKRSAYAELGEQCRALGLRPITTPVRISGVVYWKTRASDMAVEVIQDVLQGPIRRGARGSGRGHDGLVIVDDKQVMEYGQWFRRFDSKRPRVELLVETLAAEQGELL